MWCISAQSLFKNPTLSHIFTIKNNPIVSKSFIAGAGLYSERMYDKGEAVLFYDGDQVSKEQGDKLDELYQKAGLFYMFKLDKRFYIDGTVLSDKCKFINHGCNQKKNQRPIQRNNPFLNCESSKLSNFCQSNCQATSILTGSRKKILIQTERIITEGEEFAYDYGKKKVFTCNCEFRGR
ncbi:histone-lysine N-methyltransferase [Pseudoloma neurophilia]|uniref:Histone-lysine N-methyltransferase n=1 Tax=Pseudoloma neurophilia TaxID=146866 RepID=A0A0R0LR99_9MICR|nr:histone-lysine N-methyltransferase [Pseudoloma neurophilia]